MDYFVSIMNNHRLSDIKNPLIRHRADPWVFKHEDGFYYFTATVPEYDLIELRRSRTLAGLAEAETCVVWRKRDKGELASHIWAPEIHFIKGKWYIYFAAGGSEDVWHIRKYVLENDSANPMEGSWQEKGEIESGDTRFTLDATTFECRGRRYLVWAQKPGKTPPDKQSLHSGNGESLDSQGGTGPSQHSRI